MFPRSWCVAKITIRARNGIIDCCPSLLNSRWLLQDPGSVINFWLAEANLAYLSRNSVHLRPVPISLPLPHEPVNATLFMTEKLSFDQSLRYSPQHTATKGREAR